MVLMQRKTSPVQVSCKLESSHCEETHWEILYDELNSKIPRPPNRFVKYSKMSLEIGCDFKRNVGPTSVSH